MEFKQESTGATRRVRPWIAALLTLLGWGLGLFYARRTRAALWASLIQILISIPIAFGLFAYAMQARSSAILEWPYVDIANLAITLPVAIWVWRLAAKTPFVERGGVTRLLGYIGVWLLPLLAGLILAMAIRFAWMQPFRIPSASMQPTLSVGDYLVVSKASYGYSRFSIAPFEALAPPGRWQAKAPKRGDLVVFRPPAEPTRDHISRLIGLPGDRVQMIGGALHVNGASVATERTSVVIHDEAGAREVNAWRERLPDGPDYIALDLIEDSELDNTRAFLVPPGHYFMMGDNRDNADDSRRSAGFIPFDHLIGRVEIVLPNETEQRSAP